MDNYGYLKCDDRSKRLKIVRCFDVEGKPTKYNGRDGCFKSMENKENRRKRAGTIGSAKSVELDFLGSGRVGDICSFNTDCLTGMYCSTGVCTCLSNYVAISGYCYISWFPLIRLC